VMAEAQTVMRVIHVVPEITEEASGPSYSVPRLCESLLATGMDVQLGTVGEVPAPRKLPFVHAFPRGRGPRRLGFSPRLRSWLREQASLGGADVIHNHGLWMMPNAYAGWAVRRQRCRLVVSPRGTLSAWSLGRNALQKGLFWHSIQRPAISDASCFHATAESEYDDIRRLGFRQPVCVLPNGIDVPPLFATAPTGRRELLFLGRLHPKKGIDILLLAWKVVEDKFPEWDLHIVGPGSDRYRATLAQMAAALGTKRVLFGAPLYGEQRLEKYRRASLFVLPTHSENFGISVAEALAAGTPAIVTKAAPWSGLGEHIAGWWIDGGVRPLVASLTVALAASPRELADMGRAGHDWMLRDFSWELIGRRMSRTYDWLNGGGDPPPWIHVD
jgi:glycosyltransferase involved in cell wall biosynthesis